MDRESAHLDRDWNIAVTRPEASSRTLVAVSAS